MTKPAKKTVQEENDKILEIGKEGKEGIKSFVEVKKEEEKLSEEQEARIIEEIDNKRKVTEDYHKFLSQVLLAELDTLEIPSGWQINVGHTGDGVIMEVKSPHNGKIYRSAFKPSGDPKTDYNAVHTYALQAENTMYRMKTNGIIRI